MNTRTLIPMTLHGATTWISHRHRPFVLHARTITSFGGGPEKTILNSPPHLAEHGFHSACAYLHPPGDEGIVALRDRAALTNTSLFTIEDRGALDFRCFSSLLALCKQLGVTIFHAHDYKTNALGLWIRRHMPILLVSTAHGWVKMSPKLRCYYALDRIFLRHYDHVFCVSEDISERCCRAGLSPERCTTLHNAVDVTPGVIQEESARHHFRNRYGIPLDSHLMAAVGRLSPEKGFVHLLQATAHLKNDNTHVHVVIAGSGGERARLVSLAQRLGIAEHVRLVGHLRDTTALYQAADTFVLSSSREGLPNVVLEAMAMQLPIVATHVGGVSRLIVDRQTGLLIPPGSPEAIANAIQQFLSNRELAEQCARNARAKVETEFSFAKRIEKIVAVYDRLLGR